MLICYYPPLTRSSKGVGGEAAELSGYTLGREELMPTGPTLSFQADRPLEKPYLRAEDFEGRSLAVPCRTAGKPSVQAVDSSLAMQLHGETERPQ